MCGTLKAQICEKHVGCMYFYNQMALMHKVDLTVNVIDLIPPPPHCMSHQPDFQSLCHHTDQYLVFPPGKYRSVCTCRCVW